MKAFQWLARPFLAVLMLALLPSCGKRIERPNGLFRDMGDGIWNFNIDLSPIANAGNDTIVYLPSNKVRLNASAPFILSTDSLFSWRKLTGPLSGLIAQPSACNPLVTGLTAGNYTFEVKIGNYNIPHTLDTVGVEVLPPEIVDHQVIFRKQPWEHLVHYTITIPEMTKYLPADATFKGVSLMYLRSIEWLKVPSGGPNTFTPLSHEISGNDLVIYFSGTDSSVLAFPAHVRLEF